MTKKILYLDTDNVLVDFPSAFSQLDEEVVRAAEPSRQKKRLICFSTRTRFSMELRPI